MVGRGNGRRLFALVAAAAIAVGSARAQQPGQSDQVELRGDLVEVWAVVTDKAGRIRDDLEVCENGAPRDLAFFSLERVVAAPAALSTSAGSATPACAYTLRVEVQDPSRSQAPYQTADFGVGS